MRRRTLLRWSAIVASVGLAGCTGGPGDEPTTEPTNPEATDSPTPSPMQTDTPTQTASPSPAAGGDVDQTVTVGPSGSLTFSPASFEIEVGSTVQWIWDAGGHNVRPSSMPEGANWPGTEGGDGQTFGSGHTYAYTFEVAGTYEYYCAPHRGAGMTGSFRVG